MSEPAAAAVPDVLHDRREWLPGTRRHVQPRLDRVAAEAGERHVVGGRTGEPGVDLLEASRAGSGARLGQRRGPEGREVRGGRSQRGVRLQRVQGQVEGGHSRSVGRDHLGGL